VPQTSFYDVFAKYVQSETLIEKTLSYVRVDSFPSPNLQTEFLWNLVFGFTIRAHFIQFLLTHWHTQPAVRRAEPSMPLLLILALCQ
jgi:hypothetical protein